MSEKEEEAEPISVQASSTSKDPEFLTAKKKETLAEQAKKKEKKKPKPLKKTKQRPCFRRLFNR